MINMNKHKEKKQTPPIQQTNNRNTKTKSENKYFSIIINKYRFNIKNTDITNKKKKKFNSNTSTLKFIMNIVDLPVEDLTSLFDAGSSNPESDLDKRKPIGILFMQNQFQ